MKKARGMGSFTRIPATSRYRSRLCASCGSERLEALQTDFRYIRAGIFRHDSIGSPNTWTGTPCASRWAATDRPYGPDPITAVVRDVVKRGVIASAPITLGAL